MQGIPCSIDILADTDEVCRLITIASHNTVNTALQLSTLHTGLVSKVSFHDSRNSKFFIVDMNSAVCQKQTLSVTALWHETVLQLFLNTALNGWTDTAHIDQAFSSQAGSVTISITIDP